SCSASGQRRAHSRKTWHYLPRRCTKCHSLTAEQAILTEPLANIVHLFRIVSPQPFFRLAIVGAGTMGSLALLTALRAGARDILVTDVNDQRLETMRQLGASMTVNAGNSESIA